MVKKTFKNYGHYIYLYIFSCFALSLCSHFSPFYKYNFSCDPSIYLTIGRGIMDGLVPYKDLLDIKGPITFFLYAIFSPIKIGTNYFGIFILESIILCISVTFIYKTILLMSKSQLWSFALTLVYPIFLLNQQTFITGGEAEEFILPFIFILIYITLKIIKNNYYATPKQYLFLGFSVGFVFWIKFTCLGSWIAFYLCMFFILLINKNYQELKKLIKYSFLGFLIPTIFILGYFIFNNALDDLIWGYFGWNMEYGSIKENIFKKLFFMIFYSFFAFSKFFSKCTFIVWIFITAIPYLVIIFSSLVKKKSAKIMLALMVFSGIFFELSGGFMCLYYQLISIPYVVISLSWIAKKMKKIHVGKCALALIISTISLCGILKFNPSIKNSILTSYHPYQLRFAKIIQKDNKEFSILDFNELDHGWYNYLNCMPPTKHFNKMNLQQQREYKTYIDAQVDIVKKRKVKYIICPISRYKKINRFNNLVFKNYRILAQENVTDDARTKVLLLVRK